MCNEEQIQFGLKHEEVAIVVGLQWNNINLSFKMDGTNDGRNTYYDCDNRMQQSYTDIV